MSLMRKRAAVGLTLALAATGLTAPLASANPAGTGLVISEVYGAGGNTGAVYTNDFIELYNPTGSAISVDGWSVQYRSASGTTAQVTALTGSVPAGAHYLVQEKAGATVTDKPLPTPDATGTIDMSGSNGVVLLVPSTTPFTTVGDLAGNTGLADMVGYGTTPTSYETAPTGTALTATTSAARTGTGADSDKNNLDFTAGAPAPQNKSVVDPPPPPPPADPTRATIAEIQGTGDTSPLSGTTVITRGVVTATYPAGGFNGFYLQTDGTGAGTDATPGASDAVFVYGSAAMAANPVKGDLVEVTGPVSEFAGTTEITPASGGVTTLTATPTGVTPLAAAYPTTEAAREAHEGELLAPTDRLTVTNTYATNQYAEIGLATGDTPLVAPTEVVDAQDTAAVAALTAENAARAVTLDDGASINFLSAANQATPLPWLSKANPIRVGASATLQAPVILEFRNSTWKFQPTTRVTDEGRGVATFANTRTSAPEPVGGDLKLATFNVLNYFNTTGVDFVAAGGTCTYYKDRLGDPVTDNTCTPNGPRGAAEDEDLARQQAKIVAAINALGADIVSLEEIENSVALGEADRDDALSTLVDALNAAAGSTRWAFAPSPDASELPPVEEQDVIRTAFIYNPAKIDLVGASKVLVGSAAFSNAREPLAQAFKADGTADSQAFAVIVNHFKSKGSGTPDPYGQGNATADRVAQAQALGSFAHSFAIERGTDKVFLTGDFNSYTQEDPMQVLYDDGYTAVESDTENEWTYSFSGMSGSLDHVLANDAALGLVTGADIWSINSGESVAFEYSRHNYNVTDFYEPNVFRASDHDPEIVGITIPTRTIDPATSVTATAADLAYGTDGTVTATVTSDGPATGVVEVLNGGDRLGSADVVDGTARVTIPGTALTPGTYTLTVRYLGDEQHDPSATTVTLRVTKATPQLTATPQSRELQVRKDSTTINVTVAANGVVPTGYVLLVDEAGTVVSWASLSGGKAVLRTGTFDTTGTKHFEVRYLGDDLVSAGSTTTSVDVVKGKPKG